MPKILYLGDPSAVREEARSLVTHGRLSIEEQVARGLPPPGQYFVQNPRSGEWFSKYGIINGLMTAPALLAERLITGDVPVWDSDARLLYLNISNILFTMIFAWLLFQITGEYVRIPQQGSFTFSWCVTAPFFGTTCVPKPQNYFRSCFSQAFTYRRCDISETRPARKALKAHGSGWAYLS